MVLGCRTEGGAERVIDPDLESPVDTFLSEFCQSPGVREDRLSVGFSQKRALVAGRKIAVAAPEVDYLPAPAGKRALVAMIIG